MPFLFVRTSVLSAILVLFLSAVSFANTSEGKDLSENNSLITISSVPAGDFVTIRYIVPRSSEINLTLIDSHGRMVATLQQGYFEQGGYRLFYPVSMLPKGNYTIHLEISDAGVTSNKILKLN